MAALIKHKKKDTFKIFSKKKNEKIYDPQIFFTGISIRYIFPDR